MSPSYTTTGVALARVLDNMSLISGHDAGPAALHDKMAVALSEDGVYFMATDGILCGKDGIGYDSLEAAVFEVPIKVADEIIDLVRPLLRNPVSLRLDEGCLVVSNDSVVQLTRKGEKVTIEQGDLEEWRVYEASKYWSYIEAASQVVDAEGVLPAMVAFAPERFTKLGRIKSAVKAPIDLRFVNTPRGPRAVFKVGATFIGSLQCIERGTARTALGEDADDCLWD